MIVYIQNILKQINVSSAIYEELSIGIAAIAVLLLSVILNFVAKKVILKIFGIIIKKTKSSWDDILLNRGVFNRLSHIVPALVIYGFAYLFAGYTDVIQRFVMIYMVVIGITVFSSLLSAVEDIYNTFEVSKLRPIKSYLQVVKIFVVAIGVIIVVGTLINKSPWKLLTGIGAMTALIMLVFKDSILGLVGGIQLAANDMVRIGDWIEVDKYNADGDVIDISLNTIKVQNWDKTITTIPTYSMVSESFKNWRGMNEAKGRRIKRSVYIDMTSIAFCDNAMIEKYSKIQYLKNYIEQKTEEIDIFNKKNKIDKSILVNGRSLTNIGTFRAYIFAYLKNHQMIRNDMTTLVRQLPPSEKGLPIEIYAFSSDIIWANYEDIQADIFDHILAVVPQFDLKVFQNPTGVDFRDWSNNKNI